MTYNTYIAANTQKGFFSYFDELLRDCSLEDVYLIKGGPGCGKSTFMKKICDKFDDKGFTIEKIYCSSDPNSLDGIKIIELNKVIIDATPPHSFDMKYPGIIDNIIDFSQFWNTRELKENKNNIQTLFDVISKKYNEVYSVLKSAGILYTRQQMESETNCDRQKISDYVKKCIKQNAFIPIDRNPTTTNRFLSAISFSGNATLSSTIDTLCDNGIIIEDEMNISSFIISRFASYFKKSGFDVIVFHNPLCPDYKIDHIIIPKLKFGIITSNSIFNPEYDNEKFKKINSKNFIFKNYISDNKNKISLRKKIVLQLLESVIEDLKEIKGLHDELENYYIKSIDYKLLNEYTESFYKELFNN